MVGSLAGGEQPYPEPTLPPDGPFESPPIDAPLEEPPAQPLDDGGRPVDGRPVLQDGAFSIGAFSIGELVV